MTRVPTRQLTSYDLIKTAAVIFMIVDHIGAYFFPIDWRAPNPDHLWWRAVGRLGVPAWFYLVGHARSRDLSAPIWLGASLLVIGNVVAGMQLFPFNALWTIIVIRLLLDGLTRRMFASRARVVLGVLVLLALEFPSKFVVEYGSLALLMALVGWMWRRRAELRTTLGRRMFTGAIGFILASCVVLQITSFKFPMPQALLAAGLLLITFVVLMRITARELPALGARLPRPLRALVQLFGRRTLEIYVLHLLVFKFSALLLELPGFGWFAWRLF